MNRWNKMFRKRYRGMSMMELIGVMVVIGVLLATAGTSVSKNVKRSNREAVVNELQIYATGISDAYYDLGTPSFNPSDPDALDGFKRYLQVLQNNYLAVTFDFTTLVATDKGFEVTVASPKDTFENPYKFWFVTSDDVMKYAMVASGGDDGQIDVSGYANQVYGDDIVLIVRPKS